MVCAMVMETNQKITINRFKIKACLKQFFIKIFRKELMKNNKNNKIRANKMKIRLNKIKIKPKIKVSRFLNN